MRTPWLCLAALCLFPVRLPAYDYPTIDRVQYVEACVLRHPDRSRTEMLYKCSCSIDAIALEIPFDQFVDLDTASKALSIAGERGEEVRESGAAMAMAKQFKEVQERADKHCLLTP